ncbi:hypothetical protein Tco_0391057 [Tanacetum coccineum]
MWGIGVCLYMDTTLVRYTRDVWGYKVFSDQDTQERVCEECDDAVRGVRQYLSEEDEDVVWDDRGGVVWIVTAVVQVCEIESVRFVDYGALGGGIGGVACMDNMSEREQILRIAGERESKEESEAD